MVKCRVVLVASALAAFLSQAFSQLITWESLDGPYRIETRTHIRYADGDRRYFGGNSGTYRTVDGGLSWIPVSPAPMRNLRVYRTDSGTHLALTDTAVAAVHPDHGIQQALYVSTDRGETWSNVYVGRLWILALGGGDTVYRAAGRADAIAGATSVSRSTNGGATWTSLLTPVLNWGFNQLYTQPNNVFAHMDGQDLMSLTLRSTNGGTTWDTLDADQAMFHPPDKLIRVRRDYTGKFSAYAFIELSTNNGATWSSRLTADSGFSSLVTNGNGNLLVLRKPEHWVFRSTDAGLTWVHVADGPAGDPFTSIRYYGKTRAIATTKGGAQYRTINHGTTWTQITDIEGTALTGAVQPASDSLFVVADVRGNWLESTDAGASWTSSSSPFDIPPVTSMLGVSSGSLFVGTSVDCQRKRGNEDWLSAGIAGPVWDMMYRSGPLFIAGNGRHGIHPMEFNGGVYGVDTSVTPSGSSWSSGGSITYYGVRNDYNSVHAITDNVIVAGWGNRMVRTTNRGVGWSYPITSGKRFVAICADSSGNLWAGNDSTGAFKSTDQGVSWTASNAGLTDTHVLTMTVARNGYLLVGTPSGIYRSTDNGANWAYAALSTRSVQSLETGSGSRVFAGTSNGFYLSTNSGANWSSFVSGLEDTDIRAVVSSPDGEVYCGTAEKGVYRMVEAEVGIPALIRPLHMAKLVPRPVRLLWHSVQYASGYDILVSTSSLFPRTGTWDTTLTRNRDTIVSVAGLKGGITYYWKVRARSSTGYGSYAKYRSFTTSSTPAGYEVVLLFPRDGTTLTADSALCIWRAPVNKVTRYWLEYSVDSTFAKANRDSSITDTSYTIRLVTSGKKYFWRVKGYTGSEWAEFSDVFSFTSRLTDASSPEMLPSEFALEQNYPNPFNPVTVIRYQVPVATVVRLVVYDLLGREVAVLLDERREPGRYQLLFDGTHMSSGVYVYRVLAGGYTECKKMLLLK